MLEGSEASFGSLVFGLVFAVVLLCLATVVAINKGGDFDEISLRSASGQPHPIPSVADLGF